MALTSFLQTGRSPAPRGSLQPLPLSRAMSLMGLLRLTQPLSLIQPSPLTRPLPLSQTLRLIRPLSRIQAWGLRWAARRVLVLRLRLRLRLRVLRVLRTMLAYPRGRCLLQSRWRCRGSRQT